MRRSGQTPNLAKTSDEDQKRKRPSKPDQGVLRRVAQGVGDAQCHGDLVAIHQEAPDLGLVGIALDELLVAVGHLRSHRSKCNTNAFAAL